MAKKKIQLQVDIKETGASKVSVNIDKITKSAQEAEYALNSISKTIGYVGQAVKAAVNIQSIREFFDIIDSLGYAFARNAESTDKAKVAIGQYTSAAGSMANTVSGVIATLTNGFSAMWGKFNQSSGIASGVADGYVMQAVKSAQHVREFFDIGDNYRAMSERVRMAVGSMEEYEYAQKRILASANTSFRPLEDAQELFIATSDNLRDMGYSLEESLDITDSLGYAFVRNAASADKVKAAISQYTFAIAKGSVEGNEWLSMLSTAPTLAKDIAAATGKSTEQIKSMGKAGKITAEMLNKGLLNSFKENKSAAGSMANTVSGAIVTLTNEFSAMWGEFNQSSGTTSGVANSIIFIAENLQYALVPMLAIAAVTAAKFVANLVSMIVSLASLAVGFVSAQAKALQYEYTVRRIVVESRVAAAAMATGAVAAKGFSAAMAFVGGPVGALMSVASAVYAIAGSMKAAKVDSVSLGEGLADLEARIGSMNQAQLDAAREKSTRELESLRNEYNALEKEIETAKSDSGIILHTGFGRNAISFKSDESKEEASKDITIMIGKLADLGEQLKKTEGQYEKFASTKPMEQGVKFSGEALVIYEQLNKQLFMFNKENDATELSYQRQHGSLKDIEDIQYETLRLKSKEVATAKLLADNEKDLTSILSSAKEQYDNIGKSVKEITVARAIDKGATDEQLEDLKKWLSATNRIGGPSSGGGTNHFGDKLKSINEELEKMKLLNQEALGDVSKYTAVKELTLELNNQHSALSNINEKQRESLLLKAEELDSQKQLNEILTLSQDYTKTFDDMNFELSLMGQTQDAIEELKFARELEIRTKAISIGMSKENIALLEEEIRVIQARRDAQNTEQGIKNNDPFGGISDGFAKYAQSMGTVREQFANVTQTMFGGLTDSIVNFALGADKNFGEMTRSILQNISKMLIQMAILNAMDMVFGGFFKGLGGKANGGIVGLANGGFAEFNYGGFTGVGGKYEPAGIVHRGEVVFSQADVARHGGVHQVERMRKGFANGGGYVPPQFSQQAKQNEQPLNVNVIVYEDGSVEVEQSGVTGELRRYIDATVEKKIANNKRPGGLLRA